MADSRRDEKRSHARILMYVTEPRAVVTGSTLKLSLRSRRYRSGFCNQISERARIPFRRVRRKLDPTTRDRSGEVS